MSRGHLTRYFWLEQAEHHFRMWRRTKAANLRRYHHDAMWRSLLYAAGAAS